MNKKHLIRLIGCLLIGLCCLAVSVPVMASEGKTDIEVIILPSETSDSTAVSDQNDGTLSEDTCEGSESVPKETDPNNQQAGTHVTHMNAHREDSVKDNHLRHDKNHRFFGLLPQTGGKNERYYIYLGIVLAFISIGFIIKKIYGGKYNEKN